MSMCVGALVPSFHASVCGGRLQKEPPARFPPPGKCDLVNPGGQTGPGVLRLLWVTFGLCRLSSHWHSVGQLRGPEAAVVQRSQKLGGVGVTALWIWDLSHARDQLCLCGGAGGLRPIHRPATSPRRPARGGAAACGLRGAPRSPRPALRRPATSSRPGPRPPPSRPPYSLRLTSLPTRPAPRPLREGPPRLDVGPTRLSAALPSPRRRASTRTAPSDRCRLPGPLAARAAPPTRARPRPPRAPRPPRHSTRPLGPGPAPAAVGRCVLRHCESRTRPERALAVF